MNADYSTEAGFNCVNLPDLEKDMKRMLKVQFKEFVHLIEDHELTNGIHGSNRFNLPIARGCSLYRLHIARRHVA